MYLKMLTPCSLEMVSQFVIKHYSQLRKACILFMAILFAFDATGAWT